MVDLQEKSIELWRDAYFKLHSKLRKVEDALIALKAMHHEGGIDDIVERDDRSYFIICEALEEINKKA